MVQQHCDIASKDQEELEEQEYDKSWKLEDVDKIFKLAEHQALSRLTTLAVYLSLLRNWDLLEPVSRSPRN